MKHFFFTLFFSAIIIVVTAQENNLIVIGKVDSVYSNILKEQRKVLVYNPATQKRFPGSEKYPVVYLLDGEGHFNSVVGMIEQLSMVNGNTVLPQMIVVGITNTNRMRDLTPTKVQPGFGMDSITASFTGGGENFISFIEKELIPHIDSAYPVAPYRMFIGHSLGGLMAVHALINHKNLFNSYVAIDPSMWYDNESLLKQTQKALQSNSFAGKSLYLGIANTMEKGMDTVRLKKDTSFLTKAIRANFALGKYLTSNKQNNLNTAWKYYNDEDHGSVPLIAEYDALRFFFKDHKLNLGFKEFMDPNYKIDSLFTHHYKNVSKILGYEVKAPEDVVNQLGYEFLFQKQLDKAEKLFKLNTINYPQSSNTFDSLGDLYDAKGEKTKAIESYKKALAIREVPDTRKKLNDLLAK